MVPTPVPQQQQQKGDFSERYFKEYCPLETPAVLEGPLPETPIHPLPPIPLIASVSLDGTSANKLALRLLQAENSNLYIFTCMTHALDLVLKDFSKVVPWINVLSKDTIVLSRIFKNQSKPREMLAAKFSKRLIGFPTTRFRYLYLTIQRLLEAKEALEDVVQVMALLFFFS